MEKMVFVFIQSTLYVCDLSILEVIIIFRKMFLMTILIQLRLLVLRQLRLMKFLISYMIQLMSSSLNQGNKIINTDLQYLPVYSV